MIRMSKLTDYGIVLLAHLARNPTRATCNARCLASEAHLPVPTVSKILKALARAGLLVAHRGVKGGFSLARRPEEISMAQIISAMEAAANGKYRSGFVTDIDAERAPGGRNEDIVRLIRAKKNEPRFMLDWRLKAYRQGVKLEKPDAEPPWSNIHSPPIDYQDII